MMFGTFAVALMSGACVAGFMAMVTKVLEVDDTPAAWMLWTFVGLAAGRLLTNFIAQVFSRTTRSRTASICGAIW
jgi:hypothetical protein